MAFGTSNTSKKFSWVIIFLIWSTGIFIVGWQSPQLIGGPFVAKEQQPETAKFYPLDKFVISVPGDEYPHYLLLEMALKSRSINVTPTLKEADPLVRNTLMKMFSRKHFKDLNNSDQLDSLQKEALVLLSGVLAENHYTIELEEVLFTRMVIQ
ncbi:flagellar basal body-associated FliL family protein [Shewanella sp. D64]|uniref:flagellar basal body-associated FliL family protein n=1 Tax=unclassified Shewanella TaxID=196818 RepID=UPI0022BA3AD8|nr:MULTISPECIES: flagellar basal body-associated FliL family protein [unclassified Shewanella]MEC4725939.1 flagellar basal body-associated FliL family protein [Shewanella sp. D64]MEC4737194.1 flagellar basal body-associated FliL family protein [Shewanella sp. E94]WBJ95614.1 flagellar basal body-associated FliL family protein [Shewanella sp. MTB7]